MIRMLMTGYCYGIRSERRLCEKVEYNLAYRWFCRLGLEDDIPAFPKTDTAVIATAIFFVLFLKPLFNVALMKVWLKVKAL